jgi:hypothetical protein
MKWIMSSFMRFALALAFVLVVIGSPLTTLAIVAVLAVLLKVEKRR